MPLLLLALQGCADPQDSADLDPQHWASATSLGQQLTAFAAHEGELLAATAQDGLQRSDDGGSSWTAEEGLPAGLISFLGIIPAEEGASALAWIEGRGLYRDGGNGWQAVDDAPSSPLLSTFSSRARTVPFGLGIDPTRPGEAWLACIGGLFHSADAGVSWDAISIPGDSGFNLLFSDVDAHGATTAATAFMPAGVLPDEYQDLLTASVFVSSDQGVTWTSHDTSDLFRYPAGVSLDAFGRPWVAAQDGGLFRLSDTGWEQLGGPSDAVAVEVDLDGQGASLASATRGVWRWEAGAWSAAGSAPVMGLADSHAASVQGEIFALGAGAGEPPAAEGDATVHLALSFHVNLYHSYRGDTNDDDGYGLDLDVMRAVLDWLDAYPAVHGDWDIENAFSLEGWLASDGADVLARIQQRVASGQDGLRLMSWNNGAVASETEEEFEASIAWAQESLLAVFGEYDPGVQPQECMFSRHHIGWYRQLGVDWITLFHSGTPFTALRPEMELPAEAWYAPSTITDGQDGMTLVPVYHHGDLLNHGGLYGWTQQVHASQQGDQLLVIHFDADAESWEAFDQELAAIAELDFVQFTTIQDYLDAHQPVLELDAPYDMADGTGDGFQSWAEKDFNHEIATGIVQAREAAAQATALAGDEADVAALLDAALEPRLLALSTTHFGLAAPHLHETRMERAREYVQQALDAAQEALDAARDLRPVQAGSIRVLNTRASAGTALVEILLAVAAQDWSGAQGLQLFDERGAELAAAVELLDEGSDPVQVRAVLVLDFEAEEERWLVWSYDPQATPATGEADPAAADLDLPLAAPFSECDGALATAEALKRGQPTADERAVVVSQDSSWSLPFCDGEGSVRWRQQTWQGLPGTVLQVEASVGSASDPDDAESLALAPLACGGEASTISWLGFDGSAQTRPVRSHVQTWNGQAVDSWISLACEDGDPIQVSHRATERSSLALAPLRNIDGQAILAPLGTLWGDPPRHDVRRTGGHGMGDVSVGIIGSQFSPAAPDWSGRSVSYTLLVGSDIDSGTLDLFAHPPLVQVGE